MQESQNRFKLHSEYTPTGDQPQAIDALVQGVKDGNQFQTLLGVTGSGKTFTMANIIEKVNKPTLVLAHNKTLAAQLCSEFREFFPENAVEFFVSYYDYYQPEAYIPSTDTYIEKDSQVNDEIDRLRHSATAALFERRDVIIVASVSCIYGLGDPEDYTDLMLSLRPGMQKDRDEVIDRLIEMRYERNDMILERNNFRVRGDTIELVPSDSSTHIVRIEFFGDEIDRITEYDAVSGEVYGNRTHLAIFPASHYATKSEKILRALDGIEKEMYERIEEFNAEGKPLEAYRIEQRTKFDLEMLRETGFCQGIENYSRHMSGRAPGSAPYTLLDYFPDDFLLMIDESHVTVPQVRAMFNGDRARKKSLVDFGFRLPSAFDNRPLSFAEFEEKLNQVIFVSATPAEYERSHSLLTAEQIIRPTGLLDPEIIVRPVEHQVDDLIGEIRETAKRGERVLVTTLTKKMAESLTEYLESVDIRVKYLHSEVHTVERMEIIRDLRLGEFDVLVGINLLREGLDIPEVSLVAILDADKEGFLRSDTSLVQTVGRAARNANGRVIMYADSVTDSMKRAIDETNRRRTIQKAYNEKNGIVPKSIVKSVRDVIDSTFDKSASIVPDEVKNVLGLKDKKGRGKKGRNTSVAESYVLTEEEKSLPIDVLIEQLTEKMAVYASELRYEEAAGVRDMIKKLKSI